MGTNENKIVALLLIFGSLMLVMGIFDEVSSSAPIVQSLNTEDNYSFEALQDQPPGGKPTDRTDRPDGPPPFSLTNPVSGSGDNLYSIALPSALFLGGFIVLAFGVVVVVSQYNRIDDGNTTRRDVIHEIFRLDDEFDDVEDRREEHKTAKERTYEEARELAVHDEWNRILDAIESYLVDAIDYKTNMTNLVKSLLPLRDSGEIGLSRRKITTAIWLLIEVDLLVRNDDGEISLEKEYENRVLYFLDEMKEHLGRNAKIEEEYNDGTDNW